MPQARVANGRFTAGLLALALAGCTGLPLAGSDADGDEAGWSPLRCDPTKAGAISEDAPLAAGLRQAPHAIAADLAAVLGDPLAARVGDDPARPSWLTVGGGSLSLSLDSSGGFFLAAYRGPADVDRHVVERVLDRWSVAPETVWMGSGLLVAGDTSDGPAFQVTLDRPVVWANGGATWSREGADTVLAVLPFYDLPLAGRPVVAIATAEATAAGYAACAGLAPSAATGLAEVLGIGVLHGSLGYVVEMPRAVAVQECPAQDLWVFVDTGTGAVLGSYGEPCR